MPKHSGLLRADDELIQSNCPAMPRGFWAKRTAPQLAFRLSTILLTVATFATAVETHVWQQDDAGDLQRGTVKNLSVRSDGRVTLAPVFHEIADLATPYLWAVVEDSHGTLYCAGGAPTGSSAKVFSVTPQGKSKTLAELNGLEIHALAVDRQDRIYAATSPDSKIYRIGPDGKAELFYDTKAKYVWALAFDSESNLYVASGDQGVIYRVTPDGKGSEFFKTEETHARSMVVDTKGNLIVGTEPGGYVIRITPSGKSFVLFQSSKREITALALHGDTIYAAAAGVRTGRPTAPALPGPSVPSTPPGGLKATTITIQQPGAAPTATPPSSLLAGLAGGSGGSELFRVEQDGFAERIWSSPTDLIYAIGLDAQGAPLLGTGNKGVVYRVDSPVISTQLLTAPPTQVTAFSKAHNGVLYATTGNVGKLYAIGPGFEKTGTFESEVLDASSFATWGKAHLLADLNGGKAALSTRSGNVNRPQKNWNEWEPIEISPTGGQIKSAPARFLQYKLTLSASSDDRSPNLTAVQLAYLPRNIAPLVRTVEVEDANYRSSNTPNFLERATMASGSPLTLTLPAMGQPRKGAAAPSGTEGTGITLQYAKGYLTIRWDATDENNDTLVYRVEIRGKSEKTWRLLKDKIQEKHFSFDGSAFADGEYVIRVTASDEPSNTPAQSLTSSNQSDVFTIDNTPPQLTSAAQKTENGAEVLRFSAKDALSWIDKAEYSVNGVEWILLEPQNKVTDSQQLDYELRIPKSPQSEQVVAIRVFDEADNESVIRFVVPGP